MTESARRALLADIEAELRRLGLLSGQVAAPAAVRSAFGAGEMPFEQWLATVFLPRAREAAASGRWPPHSDVGTAAVRNLDGRPDCVALVDLLCAFDQTFDPRR